MAIVMRIGQKENSTNPEVSFWNGEETDRLAARGCFLQIRFNKPLGENQYANRKNKNQQIRMRS